MKGFKPGFWIAVFALLLSVRLCHLNVLWVDEAYGIAAARRILEGARLYDGIWFDKPPLYGWIYLLMGAETGWPLRLGGALFALLCCWLAAQLAAALFGAREGWLAAAGMAFFLSFYHPVAVLPLAPDLLLLPFVLGALWAIAANRPLVAGICAAAGLLANAKALLLLPLILIWRPQAWKLTLAAYGLGAVGVWVAAEGWWEPVWAWGAVYSRDSFVENPIAEGFNRTLGWAGFHAALVIGAAIYFLHKSPNRWRMAAWILTALAMVAAGSRFFPRYYFALLPALTVAAARGYRLVPPAWAALLLIAALAIPAARFGPRHIATLRGEPAAMRDLAMWKDSQKAAAMIRAMAKPGDTLLVWGYRPELNVMAGLPGATRFLDSQPLTGVLADRHLTRVKPSMPELAQQHRQELLATEPTFIADGLGPYNPALAITHYEDLRPWLAQYKLVGETEGTRIYQRW